jgi:putative flippase GtrA
VQNELRARQVRAQDATSRQTDEGERVAPVGAQENSPSTRDSTGEGFANSSVSNDMQGSVACAAESLSRKAFAASSLRGFERLADGENTTRRCKRCEPSARASMLIRWCKFNLVGAIGILVQFAVLFFLKSVMQCNYLVAAGLAVEAAVVHNFVWHERYTWAERVANTSGAEARHHLTTLLAAQKIEGETPCRPCGTRALFSLFPALTCRAITFRRFAAGVWYGASFGRFLRFNLSTGVVSILGNLAMMRVMVGVGQVNYLWANGIAIAFCSLANFLVSDAWVFGE